MVCYSKFCIFRTSTNEKFKKLKFIIFPWYYMYSDVCSRFKYLAILYCVTIDWLLSILFYLLFFLDASSYFLLAYKNKITGEFYEPREQKPFRTLLMRDTMLDLTFKYSTKEIFAVTDKFVVARNLEGGRISNLYECKCWSINIYAFESLMYNFTYS